MYYLATTGISEIWDLKKKLLLLGPWCLTSEKNKKLLENRDYVVIPSPWKPVIKIKEAEDYCYKVYDEILPQLSENLNSIHQVSYPVRYWRVLLGPWLLHFIGILYDRYKRIENILDIFPNLYTHVLPREQCRLIAYDIKDLLTVKANDDYYNFKLFSLVANVLCPQNIIEKNFEEGKSKFRSIKYNGYDLKRIMRYGLKLIFKKLLDSSSQSSIVLSDMYHLTPEDMFLLKAKIGFKEVSFKNFYSHGGTFFKNKYSHNLREALKLKGASDRFQSLLYIIIPDAIPMCYMENYKYYRDRFKDINYIKAVGSDTGWYFNEEFKFFAAELASKGAKLIDFQHGGGYGMSLSNTVEFISLEKDIFYTWGWNLNENGKTKFLPSPHLSRLKDIYSSGLDKILFVGVNMPRYHYRFQTALLPEDMPKYFEDKKRFFHVLINEIRSKILYRPYSYEYGWGEIEIIKSVSPKTQFISNGVLVNWMQKVKLVVIDHSHTSFLEALTINVPSIFYWDHEVYLMRPEAEPYFELLRKAGILYKDPESAAEKVNAICNDVQGWWLQPEVQKAKDEFCHQFARTSRNWRKEWVKVLRSLSNENR